MAKSLQDQLLEAGALNKERAIKLKKSKHKQDKQRARGAAVDDEVKRAAQRAAAEKVERDRELSRQRQAALDAKAIAAQVRQLIERNRIDAGTGESAYKFTDDTVIKTLHVSAPQHAALAAGRIAIARLDGSYVLIAAPVAEKIRERDAAAVVVLNAAESDEVDADDPYADYQIPDDLSW